MTIRPVSFGCECCQNHRPTFVKVGEGMYVNPQSVFAIKGTNDQKTEIISNNGLKLTPPKESEDYKGMELEEYPSCETIKNRLEAQA